jgi:hypothetical protein
VDFDQFIGQLHEAAVEETDSGYSRVKSIALVEDDT